MLNSILVFIHFPKVKFEYMISKIKKILRQIINAYHRIGYPNVANTAVIEGGVKVYNKNNLVMGHNTNIYSGAVIMNTQAKFIMKENSGSAIGLMVVTGNHVSGIIGKVRKEISDEYKKQLPNPSEYDKDIIVEEDVWLGANVTLLFGSHIKRGATVGNGSVVRTTIPPYSIAIGNPAKVIGFVFTPEQIIEHEKQVYPENQRLPIALLQKNYKKHFLERIKEINTYIKP